MSTKKETTNHFDASAMSTYRSLMPGIGHALNTAMADPWHSSAFNANLALANRNAQFLGQRMNSNVLNNYTGPNVSGFAASQINKNQRAASSIMGSNYSNLINQALASRLSAAGIASQFRPLQTGQTEQTGGLGTWLPQLGAAVIGGAMGAAGGGAGGAMAGGGAAATKAASAYGSIPPYNNWFPTTP
jgi:hypothetical protein